MALELTIRKKFGDFLKFSFDGKNVDFPIIVDIDRIMEYKEDELNVIAKSLFIRDVPNHNFYSLACAIRALYCSAIAELPVNKWLTPINAIKSSSYVNQIVILTQSYLNDANDIIGLATFRNGYVDGFIYTPNLLSFYRYGNRHGSTREYENKELLYKAHFSYGQLISVDYTNESKSNHLRICKLLSLLPKCKPTLIVDSPGSGNLDEIPMSKPKLIRSS